MYVTGITSGPVRTRTIATPSKTSSASATPTIRRFDVLLNEQVTLVNNAQDGLRQSLQLYEKAASKEEQESARLQVQSLLTRAEELVLSLQVVIHIRRELTHTQLYVMELRKNGKDTTEVLERLSWLEHRLEKLLFARRRGRPGARGKRTQINRQYMAGHESQMDTISRRPPSSPIDRVSTALPSITAGDSDESDSDFFSSCNSPDVTNKHSSSNRQDSGHSYCTDMPAGEGGRRTRESSKSKKRSSSDSMRGYDATKGQDLSVVHSSDSTTAKPPILPSYMLNFERPRSNCDTLSWNSLPLAMYSSFLSKGEDCFSYGEHVQSEDPVMDALIEKIKMFASYIEKAAQSFTTPGLSFPSAHRKLSPERRHTSSSRLKQSSKKHTELSPKLTPANLSPLQLPCIESSVIIWSRRKYGSQQSDDDIYPKSYTKWHSPKESDKSCLSKPIRRKGSSRLPSQFRVRHTSRKPRSQSSEKCSTDEEYFEPEKHRQHLIQDLLLSLGSPIDDVRKDSAEALGALGAGRVEVTKPLEDLMVDDSNYLVQYEAAKSLITLGKWSKDLIDFISYSLNKGSLYIQADLLELLTATENLSQLENYSDSYVQCVHFITVIVGINATSRLSLLAALVLSNMNHHHINCQAAIIDRLQAGLTDVISQNRSKALSSLAFKWHIKDTYIVEAAFKQLCSLYEWKLRLQAIKVLLHIGSDGVLKLGEAYVFNILIDKLSSDPIQVVRLNVGNLVTAVGFKIKALDQLLRQLNDHNDSVRTRAVMAMGNFDLKGTKYMQGLLDLLELDANKNVRIQVLRVFGNLKFYEARVIEKLLERDKGTGIIAKEAQKALKNLEKENVIKGYVLSID